MKLWGKEEIEGIKVSSYKVVINTNKARYVIEPSQDDPWNPLRIQKTRRLFNGRKS